MVGPAVCELGSGRCGVLAVGRCSRCKLAFCQSHQALVDRPGAPTHGSPVVDQCAHCQRSQKIGAAATSASTGRQIASVVSDVIDPTERLLVAILAVATPSGAWKADRTPDQLFVNTDRAARVLPEVLPDVFADSYVAQFALNDDGDRKPLPWESTAIAKWFANQAISKRLPMDGEYTDYPDARFNWRGRYKLGQARTREAWIFPFGRGGYGDHSTRDGLRDASYVTADGDLGPPGGIDKVPRLRGIALWRMGSLLGLDRSSSAT